MLRARDVVVRGLAFAGTLGVRRMELSTDGGDAWREAETMRRGRPGRVGPSS